eukprot:scaffold78040_cov49-Cyclotella_meneghiniana.AAC.3
MSLIPESNLRRREPLSQVATGCDAVSFRPSAYEDSTIVKRQAKNPLGRVRVGDLPTLTTDNCGRRQPAAAVSATRDCGADNKSKREFEWGKE